LCCISWASVSILWAFVPFVTFVLLSSLEGIAGLWWTTNDYQ
jgi:hypothetical protein